MQYVLVITEAALSDTLRTDVERQFGVRIEPLGPSLEDWRDHPARFERANALGEHEVNAVHYRDAGPGGLRKALLRIASQSSCLIDDDYDLFVDGSGFAVLCQRHPDNNDWWLRRL